MYLVYLVYVNEIIIDNFETKPRKKKSFTLHLQSGRQSNSDVFFIYSKQKKKLAQTNNGKYSQTENLAGNLNFFLKISKNE